MHQTTGEKFKYTAWKNGEPNCSGDIEFYLGTFKNSSEEIPAKLWNDFSNCGLDGFIFESNEINKSN